MSIELTIEGLPPFKCASASLRDPKGKQFRQFMKLRAAAALAMAGRAWYSGPVGLDLLIVAPSLGAGLEVDDYLGGVMDSLDGSHGMHFTFLPIVYEDDCQVCAGSAMFQSSSKPAWYRLHLRFLARRNDSVMRA